MIRWLISQVHKEGIRRRKSRQRGLSGSPKSECDLTRIWCKLDRKANSMLARLWVTLNCNNSLLRRKGRANDKRKMKTLSLTH